MKNSTLQALLGTLVGYLLIVSGLHLSEVILKQNMTAVDLGLFTAQNYSYQNAAQVSLAFYYDYFSGRDPNINAMAVPTGVETVFGGNYGNEPIIIPGAVTSIRVKPASSCTSAAECVSYDNIIAALNTYTYVHIDEISDAQPCPECADVIEQVGNTPGYAGRIIVFFRYSLSGIGLSDQTRIIDLAMNSYIRKIFYETYPSAHDQCSSYICTSTSDTACSKLLTWNSDIASVYQGSNIVFAPTYGLRSGLDMDVCESDMNALTGYFSCMHQYQPDWKGAAFFGASQCTGCSAYSIQDVASHCAGLLSWWNGK